MLAALALVGGAAVGFAADFAPPVMVKPGGVPIRVESPGFACPCRCSYPLIVTMAP